MRWNSLNGVPRGSKNGSGAIIRMRTVPMIFARNDSTVSHPFANAPGPTRIIPRRAATSCWRSSFRSASSSSSSSSRGSTSRSCGRPRSRRRCRGCSSRSRSSRSAPWSRRWRWNLLLKAQHIEITLRSLLGSFLVATYFNNFLPSNIGGDVIRISDTARHANSKTLATTVVLMDRILGLIALVFVAALGATAIGRLHHAAAPIWPVWLWAGFLAGRGGHHAGRLRAGRLRPAAAAR